jgi:hypothetical protein
MAEDRRAFICHQQGSVKNPGRLWTGEHKWQYLHHARIQRLAHGAAALAEPGVVVAKTGLPLVVLLRAPARAEAVLRERVSKRLSHMRTPEKKKIRYGTMEVQNYRWQPQAEKKRVRSRPRSRASTAPADSGAPWPCRQLCALSQAYRSRRVEAI